MYNLFYNMMFTRGHLENKNTYFKYFYYNSNISNPMKYMLVSTLACCNRHRIK